MTTDKHYYHIVPLQKIPAKHEQWFTYENNKPLHAGDLVEIELRNKKARGVVFDETAKPAYPTKAINRVLLAHALPSHLLQLAVWMASTYMCPLSLAVKVMVPPLGISIHKHTSKPLELARAPMLTSAQQQALETIQNSRKPSLLFGPTGSGKTEIYMRLITDCITQGKQCLVLIPEISLTNQEITRYSKRFGDTVTVLHSQLTKKERRAAWQDIADGHKHIIIGPRSALFAPAHKLGLIIIDEEHDDSYKQFDTQPKYHAREVADQLHQTATVRLVLGSATPSLETYYHATIDHRYQLATLSGRVKSWTTQEALALPKTQIVDLKAELSSGNNSPISFALSQAIGQTLRDHDQVFLFLNRRGTATFVMCRDCGFVLNCPYCRLPLTYHTDKKPDLCCHHCGYRRTSPATCPGCQSHRIKFFGSGTERVAKEITHMFPAARVARVDGDTVKRKPEAKKLFADIMQHKYDVVIGTQLIAKGWDLPRVQLVGIIAADAALFFPDFRAAERAFQLLTQVSGRAGRREKQGRVVLQTYDPENPVIKAIAKHDYAGFFEAEKKVRETLLYPPFTNLIKIICTDLDENKAHAQVHSIATTLQKTILRHRTPPHIDILGPARAFLYRRYGRFTYNIVLKYAPADEKKVHTILTGIKELDACIMDVHPTSLL